MPKIAPRWEGKEPVCSVCNEVGKINHPECEEGCCVYPKGIHSTTCIPALREQRDKYKSERDALKCCGNCLRYEDICFETTEGELIPRLMFRQDDRICPSWQPKEQGNE
jgi:hypothetical protein